MSGTWWVGQSELDDDQRDIISLPPDESLLVTGPPGSGKTNLLILRANYLYLAGCRNIVIITFTRALKEFIASGAKQYEFPATKVKTHRQWQIELLREFGGPNVTSSGDFTRDRVAFNAAVDEIVDEIRQTQPFDAILLDEGQDYTDDEMRIFSSLTGRLFCVADERQKIYTGKSPIETIKNFVQTHRSLRFHYRNGIKICKVADAIAKQVDGYLPLANTANYNESANPSSVDVQKFESVEEQAQSILSRLSAQRTAFPNDLIGILCPKNESLNRIWDILSQSQFADDLLLLGDSKDNAFSLDKTVVVSTFHSAKGLEFRAVHLAACDELRRLPNNRNLAFTAVTRAKTSLSVYYCNELHGYLDAALNSLEPIPQLPGLDQVFGVSQ